MKLTPEQYFSSPYYDQDLRDCRRNPRPPNALDSDDAGRYINGDEAILAGANIYRNLVRRKKEMEYIQTWRVAQTAGSSSRGANNNAGAAGTQGVPALEDISTGPRNGSMDTAGEITDATVLLNSYTSRERRCSAQ
ncbi:hypothetical protein TWF696_008394 [Orbilia brochopaga]|uniref:Uncharacterized protein n=1 Tax=Orbilia brochopaga TaxID=3140254 RepID=A0AAV9UFP3_9PEZI